MRFCFSILCVLLISSAFAQVNRCSSDEYRTYLKEQGLYHHSKKNISQQRIYNGNYTIPVVVHILYNNNEQNISDERIASQITVLNEDYNAANPELMNVPQDFENIIGNVGFSFCLVQTDLNGNPFSGINRVYTEIASFQGFSDDIKLSSQGGVDAWDTEKYLNIWVCNLAGNTLGFATFPGDVEPEFDGVVIDYEYFGVNLSSSNPYNLGRTGTHEIGHYFNLEHTFNAGCSSWDNCDDTPAIASPTYGCPSFPQESCQTVNMTMNFMDYTNDACMYMFTECQANLMLDALLNYRSNLISNTDCSVSIQEVDQSDVLIYPNPFKDFLHIDMQNTNVLVFDVYGRCLLSKNLGMNSYLDLSELSSGTYIISINKSVYQVLKY